MKIYFDESYPETQEVMIQGAMFCSDDANTLLYKSILELKQKHDFTGEIKYSEINTRKSLEVAKEIVKLFLDLEHPFFHACVLPYSPEGLKETPGATIAKKRIWIYTDSGAKLILSHIPAGVSADIFLDEELRLNQTPFYDYLRSAKVRRGSKINSVTPVKSHKDENCLIQLTDLLVGAVKHGLYPTTGKRGRYKREFCQYVLTEAKIKSYDRSYWTKRRRKQHRNFSIGYWIVPNFVLYKMMQKKRQKSRS